MVEKKVIKRGIIVLIVVFMIAGLASIYFIRQRIAEPIIAGTGVTRIGMLSEYFEGLKGSRADTEVYFLEGKEPGGTMLIVGGTHPSEPNALLSAVMFIENAVVKAGRLIVVPRAQKTGYEQTEPGRGYPPRFHIQQDGDNQRWFRMGSRIMDPVISWPNPTVYVHYPEGQTLAEGETLNLNRNHPGRPDGRLTEKLAFAIMELIRKENVSVSIDPHESPPDRPLVGSICAHERALDVATLSVLNMEAIWDVRVRLEISPKNLRGLSHREWGDYSDTLAMLIETPSPMHGPIRGKTTEKLLLDAIDEFELRAGKAGRLFMPYDEKGYPISVRNARHVQQFLEIASAWTELNPDKPIIIENMPTYSEIVTNGVGHYLAIVEEPEPWLFPIPVIRNFFFNEGRPFWSYGSNWTYDEVLGAKSL
jgi:predicted deacylase